MPRTHGRRSVGGEKKALERRRHGMAARQAAQAVPFVSRDTVLCRNQFGGSGPDTPPTGPYYDDTPERHARSASSASLGLDPLRSLLHEG